MVFGVSQAEKTDGDVCFSRLDDFSTTLRENDRLNYGQFPYPSKM
jgi:hypothetical protein